MNSTTYCIRVDKKLKKEFDGACKEFGLTPSAAFNLFAKKVVREKRIPFEITGLGYIEAEKNSKDIRRKEAMKLFDEFIEECKKSNSKEPSLDEINEHIKKARKNIITG